MFMTEIIKKKRDGMTLGEDEIEFFVKGYTAGEIPDYQAAALLMSIYLNGMTEEETVALTLSIMGSGRILDLSGIPGIGVDKHSTGGVGDKVSLVLGPLVASCGCYVPMISGRGLGHTGGTLDKLEAIPGFRTNLSMEEFVDNVASNGFSIIGQTDDIAPADRRLYALRDVTSTVASIPLIVASILSKKFASGADAFVFDVKTGNGAFMREMDQALRLARMLVKVSTLMDKKTVAFITDMNSPLGRSVGNALEVVESIEALRGEGRQDLWKITEILASEMLVLAGQARSLDEAVRTLRDAVLSGRALETFRKVIERQYGDPAVVDDEEKLPQAMCRLDVSSPENGYVKDVDALRIALCARKMGAGREKMSDSIRTGVGIEVFRKPGEAVTAGERVARVHADRESDLEAAAEEVLQSFSFSAGECSARPMIYYRIDETGEEKYF